MRGRSQRQRWGVVLETPDPRRLARFWSEVLGWPLVQDEADWATVEPPGAYGHLAFQRSETYEPPVWPAEPGRQQMLQHLDVQVDDLEAAVADAVALGARQAEHQPLKGVRVLLDPDGHVFCLFLPGA